MDWLCAVMQINIKLLIAIFAMREVNLGMSYVFNIIENWTSLSNDQITKKPLMPVWKYETVVV